MQEIKDFEGGHLSLIIENDKIIGVAFFGPNNTSKKCILSDGPYALNQIPNAMYRALKVRTDAA